MKKQTSNIWLVLILLIGLSLLLYPSFADWWNSFTQSKVIATYAEEVASIDTDKYDALWEAAWEYNESLLDRENAYILTEEQKQAYNDHLNIGQNGVMGYIEIPDLKVTLPIYHGTDEAILQVAVGHLEWTSLPVGGRSTHCVLSGHRGLTSARLFTDLDKMAPGDVFLLRVLDEVLTYEVDQITIVEPYEVEQLHIAEGEDYCTLVTCTPYGINSHRLLVRGRRIATQEEARVVRVTADAIQIQPAIVAPFLAAPVLLVLLILLMIPKKKKPRKEEIL